MKKAILTVALDDETFARILPILSRSSLGVQKAEQASEALTLARRERQHLVVCRYPLPDMKLREFLATLRENQSASKSSSLLLLTIPEMATEAGFGAAGGPFLVFSGQEPLGSLGQGAAHLLQVAPRYAPRISTWLRASVDKGKDAQRGWVADLSSSGMLVTDVPMLPVGATCAFEFGLPHGEVISGRGEVVRHAKPRRERVTGFALRFVDFDDGCLEALEKWCELEGD